MFAKFPSKFIEIKYWIFFSFGECPDTLDIPSKYATVVILIWILIVILLFCYTIRYYKIFVNFYIITFYSNNSNPCEVWMSILILYIGNNIVILIFMNFNIHLGKYFCKTKIEILIKPLTFYQRHKKKICLLRQMLLLYIT